VINDLKRKRQNALCVGTKNVAQSGKVVIRAMCLCLYDVIVEWCYIMAALLQDLALFLG